MRRLRYLPLPLLLVSLLTPTFARAAPWVEDKVFFSENASFSSSKVDAADLNGDGWIDVVFANGQGFDKGDDSSEEPQQAFLNDNGTALNDASQGIFGGLSVVGRAVKLRDIDYDGDNDILLGTTWQTQSQLLLNDGSGTFTNVTAENLPQGPASVGDVELGDVDDDGDLDIALSNWGNPGPGLSVAQSEGGVTLLWRQMGEPAMFGDEGTGMFEDVTLGQMPNTKVRWSWELEFVDVDNDWDLDLVVSAFAGDVFSVHLFTNDGSGTFAPPVMGAVPQGKFGLDVEVIDLDDDSFMDILSVHDGANGRNRILINDKTGKFADKTNTAWNQLGNPASYDFTSAFYDYDSNGDVDFVLGAIQTAQDKYPDRLIYKAAKYEANNTAFSELTPSAGTYSVVLADFNQDRRLDMAMAQKENATQKKVFIATEEIPVDIAAPIFPNYEKLPAIQYPGNEIIRVRCHDNKSPLMLHDFTQDAGLPYLESWTEEPADPENMPGAISAPGQWYGEYLWRINFEVPDADALWYRICAIDAAGNKACTPLDMTVIEGGTETESDSNSDSMTDTLTDSDSAASVTDSVTESDSMSMSDSLSESDSLSDSDSFTESSTESQTATDTQSSMSNSDSLGPTESNSDSNNVPTESDTITASDVDTNTDTADSADMLDDDGCGCDTDGSPAGGVLSSLALLGLLGLRRRRV